MTAAVLLDLNFPDFQAQLFQLDANELRQAVRTLRKISRFDWQQVYADHGLKWEELKSVKGRFTIRVARQCRAVVMRDADYMRFLALHFDHDGAYT